MISLSLLLAAAAMSGGDAPRQQPRIIREQAAPCRPSDLRRMSYGDADKDAKIILVTRLSCMRLASSRLPLPGRGEGWGEGKRGEAERNHLEDWTPSPNPLPRGEGYKALS